MSDTWIYSAGDRGVNRVRVYERSPDSPLWIKWSDEDNKPVRRSLRVVNDRPIYDRKLAIKIADRTALKIKEAREIGRDLRDLLGLRERHTLEELSDEYFDVHTSEKPDEGWSDKHQTDQERYRDFWLEKLGRETYLRDVTGAAVEKAANRTSQERDWSAGTTSPSSSPPSTGRRPTSSGSPVRRRSHRWSFRIPIRISRSTSRRSSSRSSTRQKRWTSGAASTARSAP